MNILQVQKNNNEYIDNNQAIIFNEIIYSNGNITYDNLTGNITINENGNYMIDWWLAIQSSQSINGIIFKLVFSTGQEFYSNIQIKTGNKEGISIIEVTSAPVTFKLINVSDSTVYLSNTLPIKANLRILGLNNIDSETNCFIYRQLLHLLEQFVEIYQGELVRVYLAGVTNVDGNILSLYKSPNAISESILIIRSLSDTNYLISINQIVAIEFYTSNYNNSITYLPEPELYVQNCSNVIVPTLYDFLEIGSELEILTIASSGFQGNLIKNEYGVIALTQSGLFSPKFAMTNGIAIVTILD